MHFARFDLENAVSKNWIEGHEHADDGGQGTDKLNKRQWMVYMKLDSVFVL